MKSSKLPPSQNSIRIYWNNRLLSPFEDTDGFSWQITAPRLLFISGNNSVGFRCDLLPQRSGRGGSCRKENIVNSEEVWTQLRATAAPSEPPLDRQHSATKQPPGEAYNRFCHILFEKFLYTLTWLPVASIALISITLTASNRRCLGARATTFYLLQESESWWNNLAKKDGRVMQLECELSWCQSNYFLFTSRKCVVVE